MIKYLNHLILVVVTIAVLTNLYIQYKFNESNWCEAEVDILRVQIDQIHQEIVKD